MHDSPLVTVIIVSFNSKDLLLRCLSRLEGGSREMEVIVVDNASRDGSAEAVETSHPWCRLLRMGWNSGFAAANNFAFAQARGRCLLLLNPDAEASPQDILLCARRLLSSEAIGAAGAQIVDPEGRPQPSARPFPTWLGDLATAMGLRRPQERRGEILRADWVPGAFFMVKRCVIDQVGGFDEKFFMYYEEVDLCLRMRRAGWDIVVWPDIRARHVGGACARALTDRKMTDAGDMLMDWRARSRLLYYRKNGGRLSALAAFLTERWWNLARSWRQSFRNGAKARATQEVCRALAASARTAWRETQGGLICPPRPW